MDPNEEAAPTAEENTVAEENQEQEVTTAPEISQAEQDALLAITDGVEGEMTENTPIDEDNEEPQEQEVAPGSDTEEVPELETEKDEEGVYSSQTTEDPGDFEHGDYSFEIKTTDGKTVNITSPAGVDALTAKLDDDPDLITASQYTLLNRKAAVMEQGITQDRRVYETDKQKFEAEHANTEVRENTLNQWSSEIKYLASNGELPEISADLDKADWTNPEVAKEPAVKARLEVFKWMEGENNKRIDAGLEPIKSVIDAHNAMQLENLKQQNTDTVSREKDQRRAKGSMVGGSSSYSPGNNPSDGIIGLGGSLDDMVTEYYNQ